MILKRRNIYCSKECSYKSKIGKKDSIKTRIKKAKGHKGLDYYKTKKFSSAVSKATKGKPKTYECWRNFGNLGKKPWNYKNGDYFKGENNPMYGRKKERIWLTCPVCKKKFKVTLGMVKYRKTCSKKCQNKLSVETSRTFRLKQIIPNQDTSIERIIQNGLKTIGIKFRKHVSLLNLYQVDLLLKPNLIVECDGDYWHNYPEGLEKDRVRDRRLKKAGFKVLRFWEHEIKYNSQNCISKINEEFKH